MARIKKIEATLVGGNKYEIIINCNSKGVFSANVPIELSMNVAGLQTKMENPKLDELESVIYKALTNYNNSFIKTRLVIGVVFGAKGDICKNDDGLIHEKFLGKSPFVINGFYCSLDGSVMNFFYKILLEEDINGSKKYFSTNRKIKYSESSLSLVPKYKIIDDFVAENMPISDVGKYNVILPYKEEILESLKGIENQLRKAAFLLTELLGNEKVELLLSNNVKMIE